MVRWTSFTLVLTRCGFREIGGSINCQLNVAATAIGDWENPDEIVAIS